MPELPEVESVRRGIVQGFLGKRIEKVWTRGLVHLLDPLSLPLRRLEGETMVTLERRGKYLLCRTTTLQLFAHLGMSGVWQESAARQTHTHVELHFEDGSWLSYVDPRQFGYLCLLQQTACNPRWDLLGPDALGKDFDAQGLHASTRKSRVSVKVWLMDQHKVAGIGNIYASEVLFAAGIHPERPVSALSLEDCANIVRECKRIMRLAVRKKGTTFSDYRLTNGRGGGFQAFLKVFQKPGEPCPACGSDIRQLTQAGRSTFYCPACQVN